MRLGVEAALVGGRIRRGDIEVHDGAIVAVECSGHGRGVAAPGFVDLQVNGFVGIDLMGADRDGYARVGDALLATGTTAFQPTFVTAPEERLLAALEAMPLNGVGPRILGAHLEGPFLASGRLGVHPPEHRRDPDLALLTRLLAPGRVTQVTMAPELPGALHLVAELVRRNITVSAGHTDATAAEAHLAFDRGVSTVTHLHNAMGPGTAREPTIVAAALSRPDVAVQVIVDGHHLAPDTVRVAWRAAAGGLALVSDAVAAAGGGDGDYRLGDRTVCARDGVVRGPEGQLAGSALTMIDAVRNLHALGVRLDEALTAASSIPARIARRPDLGRLDVGCAADIVVLDDRLEIMRVLVGGEVFVAR
jgi:N-acetylglucosamine-6-phosphate deacetylase